MSEHDQNEEERQFDYSPPEPTEDPDDSEYEDGQFGR